MAHQGRGDRPPVARPTRQQQVGAQLRRGTAAGIRLTGRLRQQEVGRQLRGVPGFQGIGYRPGQRVAQPGEFGEFQGIGYRPPGEPFQGIGYRPGQRPAAAGPDIGALGLLGQAGRGLLGSLGLSGLPDFLRRRLEMSRRWKGVGAGLTRGPLGPLTAVLPLEEDIVPAFGAATEGGGFPAYEGGYPYDFGGGGGGGGSPFDTGNLPPWFLGLTNWRVT